MHKLIITSILWLGAVFLSPAMVQAATNSINLYLFYGQECPHCEAELEWLEGEYLLQNPDVQLYKFEVWHDQGYQQLLAEAQTALSDKSSGVPYLIIGDQVTVGYSERTTATDIAATIDYYRQLKDFDDPMQDVLRQFETKTATTLTPVAVETQTNTISPEVTNAAQLPTKTFTIPILGTIDPQTVSLPLLAVVVGIVDGFNPCAMWILIFLITMLFNLQDRRKMLILGSVFLLTSALMYLVFMAGWLSVAMFLGQIWLIRMAVAALALWFGVANLKDYWQTGDVCKVVDASKRKKITAQIRQIVAEQKFWLSLVGIVVLAAGVNVIELMCSLGLPVVFTQILAVNQLSPLWSALYMLIYIFFYMLDDLIVFYLAMSTLKITTVSNSLAKYSKLIGGVIMLIVGALMLLRPEWLMFNF
jgi:glutaredoxin